MDYKKIYSKLIDRARVRVLTDYTEAHHIIPRCMGGSDDSDNLVDLTPEEHFIAHQLLIKMYPSNHSLIYAARMMTVTNNQQHRNNKMHGWLRRKLYETECAKVLSEETKQKIGEASRNRPRGHCPHCGVEGIIANLKRWHFDRCPKSPNFQIDMRTHQKETGMKQYVVCPHCKKTTNKGNAKRWHFDNCKMKGA